MTFGNLIQWFAGGRDGYMTLAHCMNHDTLWITVTVVLDLAVASGYVLIALHWRRNERALGRSEAKAALSTMKNIFIFCGLCGYLFIPVKMFWPAWRLYDMFLAVLVYLTWRYALRAKDLQVVYSELGRSARLAHDLEETKEESRRRDSFLNAVCHDLRTPLNGLVLHSELAAMSLDADDREGLKEALAAIKACTLSGSELLSRLLELDRLGGVKEPPGPAEFSLTALLHELAAIEGPRAASKGLCIEVHAPQELTVTADRASVDRVLYNLLDNAIKFSENGEIRLEAEVRTDGVVVHVIDGGMGIAPENLARIFDDFVQVHNRERDSRKGLGLGLGVARRLSGVLCGHLTVESTPGRGSRFSLLLPGMPVATGPGPLFKTSASRNTPLGAPSHSAPGRG